MRAGGEGIFERTARGEKEYVSYKSGDQFIGVNLIVKDRVEVLSINRFTDVLHLSRGAEEEIVLQTFPSLNEVKGLKGAFTYRMHPETMPGKALSFAGIVASQNDQLTLSRINQFVIPT